MDSFLKNIKEIVEKFEKESPKWKTVIYSGKENEKICDLENDLESEYIGDIKYYIKNSLDRDEFDKKVAKILGDEVLVSLRKQTNMIISVFENANVIASIDRKAHFLSECFDRAVVRRDVGFADEWNSFGFDSAGEMIGAINSINSIVINCANMGFSKNSAYIEFENMTGLDDSLCLLCAEKYDENYQEIQRKLLIKLQRDTNNYLRRIITVLSEDDNE